MKKIVISTFVLATLLTTSCEKKKNMNQEESTLASVSKVTNNSQKQKLTNQQFVSKAYAGNMAEIQMAELAQNRSNNKQVKDYAKMIKEHHNNANKELKTAAQKTNLQIPDTISSEMKKNMTEIKSTTGMAFDKTFMDLMVKDHQKAVELYQQAMQDIKDQDLNKYASNTLPILKSHLEKAKTINQSLQQVEVKK